MEKIDNLLVELEEEFSQIDTQKKELLSLCQELSNEIEENENKRFFRGKAKALANNKIELEEANNELKKINEERQKMLLQYADIRLLKDELVSEYRQKFETEINDKLLALVQEINAVLKQGEELDVQLFEEMTKAIYKLAPYTEREAISEAITSMNYGRFATSMSYKLDGINR